MRMYISSFILLAVLVAGIFVFNKERDDNSSPTADDASKAISGNLVDPTALARPAPPPPGYVRYQNNKYGFYFYHSPEAGISEFDEGAGATTIVLENFKKIRGLQIFITPYAEEEISEERFKMDIPSGIVTNLATTTIGVIKVPAITFNSYDEHLGDTREIWFVRNGLLYEITTFKGVRDWLTPIIQSWRFI